MGRNVFIENMYYHAICINQYHILSKFTYKLKVFIASRKGNDLNFVYFYSTILMYYGSLPHAFSLSTQDLNFSKQRIMWNA